MGQLEGNGIPFGQSKREKKNSSRRREQGKNYTVGVGSRREPDVAADFHKESEGKNLVIDNAIQRDGETSFLGLKPYFGSAIVTWDLEYIDSAHQNQGGAMTSGIR